MAQNLSFQKPSFAWLIVSPTNKSMPGHIHVQMPGKLRDGLILVRYYMHITWAVWGERGQATVQAEGSRWSHMQPCRNYGCLSFSLLRGQSHCFRNGRHLWDPSSCLQFIGKWGLGRFGDLPTLTYLVGSRARMESGCFGSKTSFNYTTKHLYSGNSQNLKISHLDENLSQLVYTIPVFLIQSIINTTEPFLCEARPPLWMKINVIDSVIQSLWIRIWQCSVMLGIR